MEDQNILKNSCGYVK
jgi:ABC-type multidrug transport system ATPase subunit